MGMLSDLDESFALTVFITLALFVLGRTAEVPPNILAEYGTKVNESILSHPNFNLLPHKKCGKRKLPQFEGDLSPRILHGKRVPIGEFPWMAKIYQGEDDYPVCAGSIISDKYVVSAGHCCQLFDGSNEKSSAGVGSIVTKFLPGTETRIEVKNYFKNPHLRQRNYHYDNDICLLRLKDSIVFTDYTQPICLPIYKRFNKKNQIEGKEMSIAGWGDQDDDKRPPNLLKAKVTLEDASKDSTFYSSLGYNQSTHTGDSGGPLMYYDDTTKLWFLLGVQSSSLHLATGPRAVYHSYQAKVIPHIEWILDTVNS